MTDLKTKTQSARRGTPLVAAQPEKNVRLSADITPASYRELTRISQDLAFQIGRTRVAHVDVLRALLDELIDNPSLRGIVRDRIETALAVR
jgi:hypothetical protein